ncbi:MAG: GNAT family N-acetyltransferase, partial [Balneolales bacterium]
MKTLNKESFIYIDDKSVSDNLQIQVIKSDNAFDLISDEWHALVEKADIHYVQTYDWLRSWWKHFGGGQHRLHIILFRHKQELVGIMPMYLETFKFVGLPLYRCLRMLGGRVIQPSGGALPVELPFGDYLTLIAFPGREKIITSTLIKYLMTNRHLFDRIWLEEIPEGSPLLALTKIEFNDQNWNCNVRPASKSYIIKINSPWSSYLEKLSSKARYQVRRTLRVNDENQHFERQLAHTEEEVLTAYMKLVEYHQQRWQSLGQPGIFSDDRINNFFKDITMHFHKKGWLQLEMLVKGNAYEAIDLLFCFHGTLYQVQRGYKDSPYDKRIGPGNLLLYLRIKEAINSGVKVFDFLRGEIPYKRSLSTHTVQNKEIIISNSQSWSNRIKIHQSMKYYYWFQYKLSHQKKIIRLISSSKSNQSGRGIYAKY